jgi:hypothetical protein
MVTKPPRLLAHLRRWNDRGLIATCLLSSTASDCVGEKGLQNGYGSRPAAGQGDTSRHTAATWLMQRGVPIWEAAGFLGLSPDVLQDTCGHHHPDHLHGAALAISQKGVSVAEAVADLTEDRNEKKKPNDIWSEWQDLNLRPLRPERSALPG